MSKSNHHNSNNPKSTHGTDPSFAPPDSLHPTDASSRSPSYLSDVLGLELPLLTDLVIRPICEVRAEFQSQLLARTGLIVSRYLANVDDIRIIQQKFKGNQLDEILLSECSLHQQTLTSLQHTINQTCRPLLLSAVKHWLDLHPVCFVQLDNDSLKIDNQKIDYLNDIVSPKSTGFCFVVKVIGFSCWLYLVTHRTQSTAHNIDSLVENLAYFIVSEQLSISLDVSQLELVSPSQKKHIRTLLQSSELALSQQTIHRRIEILAEVMPDAIAVCFEKQQVSYGQINRQANQLARYFQEQGAVPGSRVAVMLEPGVDVVICLVAILKANLTYVPLDPKFPSDRRDLILNDTQAEWLVIHHPAEVTALDLQTNLVGITELLPQIRNRSEENLDLIIDLTLPAYIFYTSGTTGRPKGILANHENLIYYLDAAQRKYQIGVGDKMAACARFTFSISLFELLFPLANGASLLLVKRETILDLQAMVEVMADVSFLHLGPSLLKLLLEQVMRMNIPATYFKQLRHLSSGGDMVPVSLLKTARSLFPDIELYVIYGSSEISCMGCTWQVPSLAEIERTFVGKPFDQDQLIIVDEQDQTTPLGVVGNLCFTGRGLITGYLNGKALDEQKFFTRHGQRYYRIGDRGRLSSDGNVELVGRSDFQIQLHGQRIEPAEVEFYIKQNRVIKDAIVARRERRNGEKILVAFVVAADNAVVNEHQIKTELAEFLPDYMVPVKFILLPSLPLNQNFKVDRNALPQDIHQLNPSRASGTLPVTKIEQQLATIWRELLDIEAIYLESNFLECGGDSLLSIALITKVKDELSYELYGLDIARECLAVIAAKIQGTNSLHRLLSQGTARVVKHNQSFYFDGAQLYGIYHPPKLQESQRAVLIAPAFGQESVRSYFFLKELANALADTGYAVLRFDYYGTGNSQGNDLDVSLERWQHDLNAARIELTRRSGVRRPLVLGVRLGANLAFETFKAEKIPLLLWDPIVSGHHYLHVKQRLQRQAINRLFFVKLFRGKRKKQPTRFELLGFSPNPLFIEQMAQIELGQAEIDADHIQCLTTRLEDDNGGQLNQQFGARDYRQLIQIESTENCFWDSYAKLETAITNKALLMTLLDCIEGAPL